MPWTGKQFANRHNHGLSKPMASKAASIASAIVREGGDEGVAIATANKYAKRHDGKVPKQKKSTGFGSLDGS
jgi:uncharacterized protein YdaT